MLFRSKNEPYLITRAVTDIAKAYNQFYYVHHVLDDDAAKRSAMVDLTSAVRSVIRTGLYLIGMEAPVRM